MAGFNIFLTAMCALFALTASVLLGVCLAQIARRQRQRAFIYFGLTILASFVAAGFYFFRRLL
jgi:hypothetical protein